MNQSGLWLEKAEDDLEAARYMVEGEKFSQAAFLFQQAAEKALKAVLVEEGEGLIQSHDCFLLAKKGDAPEHVRDAANALTPYYSRTRYPDANLVEIEKSEIEKVQDSAEEVIEWSQKQF